MTLPREQTENQYRSHFCEPDSRKPKCPYCAEMERRLMETLADTARYLRDRNQSIVERNVIVGRLAMACGSEAQRLLLTVLERKELATAVKNDLQSILKAMQQVTADC